MSNSNLSCILKGKIGQKWEHQKYKNEQKSLPEKMVMNCRKIQIQMSNSNLFCTPRSKNLLSIAPPLADVFFLLYPPSPLRICGPLILINQKEKTSKITCLGQLKEVLKITKRPLELGNQVMITIRLTQIFAASRLVIKVATFFSCGS